MVYYSALHYAAKAAKSAEAAADSATQASEASGKIIQVGFDGTLANGVLTFKHAPGGVETPYNLQDDFEYELDLAFASTATLPTNTQMVIKNGNDTIRFVSALHRDATTNATVADMDAVMRFNSSTGYRWLFKAAYKVTPGGDKVFLLYPVVAKEDTTKITNCITEIPQDIKLELVDGTLTLKAGSKVYVPNGTHLQTASNLSLTITGNGEYLIAAHSNGSAIYYQYLVNCVSGSTDSKAGTGYHWWFDTTNSVINRYTSNASTPSQTLTMPIAIVTVSNGAISSIDQVFNGFGYIGNTVYALPGVKGLIPNGRNEDGSLKNIEFTVRNVITKTERWGVEPYVLNITADSSAEYIGFVRAQDYYVQDTQPNNPDASWGKWFSPKDNIVYQDKDSSKWVPIKTMFCGTMSINSNRSIAGIDTKLPFRTVDMQEVNLKQDIATAVNYDNITNCITEIPQDIKLELNNGTLTLKAGSKVYVPNGAGKFDEVIVQYDKPCQNGWGSQGEKQFLFFDYNLNLRAFPVNYCFSGNTAPTSFRGNKHAIWYDTANNSVKITADGGVTWTGGNSLSLGIVVESTPENVIDTIDQVFNGFGYIGSTVFALPGVKGLIPDGRNADGSLKNEEFTVESVLTRTITDTATRDNIIVGFSPYRGNPFGFSLSAYYDENTNFNKESEGGSNWSYALIGNASYSTKKFISFTPKLPFRAVDQNDFNKLDEETAKLADNNTFTGANSFTLGLYIRKPAPSTAAFHSDVFSVQVDKRYDAFAYQGTYFTNILKDSGGNYLTYTGLSRYADGSSAQVIGARSYMPNGTRVDCVITAKALSDGTIQATAPNPASTSNSQDIATTAWVTKRIPAIMNNPVNVTTLWSGNIDSADVALSEPFTNFEQLRIYYANDDSNRKGVDVIPTASLNEIMAQDISVYLLRGANLWVLKNYANGSSTSYFKHAYDNCRLIAIQGINRK